MIVNELPLMNTTAHTLSLSELAQGRNRPCRTNPKTRHAWMKIWKETSRFKFGGSAWFGGIRNLDEATAILEQGWPSGAARIRELASEIHAPEAKAIRRKIAWRDDGTRFATIVCAPANSIPAGAVRVGRRAPGQSWSRSTSIGAAS